jgi:hypothetical protein
MRNQQIWSCVRVSQYDKSGDERISLLPRLRLSFQVPDRVLPSLPEAAASYARAGLCSTTLVLVEDGKDSDVIWTRT